MRTSDINSSTINLNLVAAAYPGTSLSLVVVTSGVRVELQYNDGAKRDADYKIIAKYIFDHEDQNSILQLPR